MAEAQTNLNWYTEGDSRTQTHAGSCGRFGQCGFACRCWCHGFARHPNGAVRPDYADRFVEHCPVDGVLYDPRCHYCREYAS